MDFHGYQKLSRLTAQYPDTHKLAYPALGLAGEAGEVAEKIKKLIRDKNGVLTEEVREELAKELGDVLWYVAQLSTELGVSLERVATQNIAKLLSRKVRGKIGGSGDNR